MLGLLLLTLSGGGKVVQTLVRDRKKYSPWNRQLMAIANNPQVGMAQADPRRKRKSAINRPDAGAKVEDTPMEATYEGKVLPN